MNNRLYRLRVRESAPPLHVFPCYCLILRGTITIPLLRREKSGAEKGCEAGGAGTQVEVVHFINMR